jgi:hypothetical protein
MPSAPSSIDTCKERNEDEQDLEDLFYNCWDYGNDGLSKKKFETRHHKHDGPANR